MTNKILFIANWKMFGNLNSVKSIESVINLSKKKNYKNAKIIYCPPYTLLNYFVIKTRKTNLDVGAQNCHYEINTGPYTGSISSTMIKKLGAKYVIIGHSENRSNGETNTQINKKIHSAILNNLNVIFCIGENLFEKKNKKTNKILKIPKRDAYRQYLAYYKGWGDYKNYSKDKKAIIYAKSVKDLANKYRKQLTLCKKNLDKNKYIIF